jgi:post-segregation antitoxin (ccd killing protein)
MHRSTSIITNSGGDMHQSSTSAQQLNLVKESVNSMKPESWSIENAQFIAEYNARIEAEGTLLQEWITF